MYAAVTMLKIKPENFEQINTAAKNAPKQYDGLKGFISAVYYSDKEKCEVGSTTLWETKEDFEAYWNPRFAATTDRVNPMIESYTQDVYEVQVQFSAKDKGA